MSCLDKENGERIKFKKKNLLIKFLMFQNVFWCMCVCVCNAYYNTIMNLYMFVCSVCTYESPFLL